MKGLLVALAWFGGLVVLSFLGQGFLLILGLSVHDDANLVPVSVVAFVGSLYVAYIVGNWIEGEQLGYAVRRTADNTKRFIGGAVRLLVGLAILAALFLGAYYLYNNMPLWAFVISVLLLLIVVFLAKLVATMGRNS